MAFGRRSKGTPKGFKPSKIPVNTGTSAEVVELPGLQEAKARDDGMDKVMRSARSKLLEDCKLDDCAAMCRKK